MTDYAFLEFIKPECVKKESLDSYIKYDSRITRFDVDTWFRWKIIDLSDYKEYIKVLIERQEEELRRMKFMLEKAEADGDKFSPFIYWGMLNGCCCSTEYIRPVPVPNEVYNNEVTTLYSPLCSSCDLEKDIDEKIGGKINE